MSESKKRVHMYMAHVCYRYINADILVCTGRRTEWGGWVHGQESGCVGDQVVTFTDSAVG